MIIHYNDFANAFAFSLPRILLLSGKFSAFGFFRPYHLKLVIAFARTQYNFGLRVVTAGVSFGNYLMPLLKDFRLRFLSGARYHLWELIPSQLSRYLEARRTGDLRRRPFCIHSKTPVRTEKAPPFNSKQWCTEYITKGPSQAGSTRAASNTWGILAHYSRISNAVFRSTDSDHSSSQQPDQSYPLRCVGDFV